MSYFREFMNKKPEVTEDPTPKVEVSIPVVKTPKTPVKETPTPISDIDSIMGDLAKTSDFKRLIFKAITGKVHRGTSKALDRELNKLLEKVRSL